MGFFDILKAGAEYLDKKNEKMNNQLERWENRSERFLLDRLKHGSLTEKMTANKLLKENFGYSEEDIKMHLQKKIIQIKLYFQSCSTNNIILYKIM